MIYPNNQTPKLSANDLRIMDRLIRGEWSTDDLVEAEMDEITTAVGVGSGPDRAIGMVRPSGFKDDKLEKLMKEFDEYLRRTKSEATPAAAKEFADRRALPESWVRKLVAYVRREK